MLKNNINSYAYFIQKIKEKIENKTDMFELFDQYQKITTSYDELYGFYYDELQDKILLKKQNNLNAYKMNAFQTIIYEIPGVEQVVIDLQTYHLNQYDEFKAYLICIMTKFIEDYYQAGLQGKQQDIFNINYMKQYYSINFQIAMLVDPILIADQVHYLESEPFNMAFSQNNRFLYFDIWHAYCVQNKVSLVLASYRTLEKYNKPSTIYEQFICSNMNDMTYLTCTIFSEEELQQVIQQILYIKSLGVKFYYDDRYDNDTSNIYQKFSLTEQINKNQQYPELVTLLKLINDMERL